MKNSDRIASFERSLDDVQRALGDLAMLVRGIRARDPGAFQPLSTPLMALAVPHGDQSWYAADLSLRYLFTYLKAAQELWRQLPPESRWNPPENSFSTVAKLEYDIARMECALDALELRLAEAREVA